MVYQLKAGATAAIRSRASGEIAVSEAEIGPAQRLVLLRGQFLALGGRETAAAGLFQRIEIECHLLAEAAVQKSADLEIAVDRAGDAGGIAAFGQGLDHQSVELGVLRLLDPVMAEQALEQRVELAIVADAAEIMGLGDPFDHQDDQGDRKWIVAQHLGGDRLGRADHRAGRLEAVGEQLVEASEEMNVLGFLAGEIEQGANAVVVSAQLRTGVIEDEGQNEFLDQPEQAEIFVTTYLVENEAFAFRQKGRGVGAGQAFGHEAPRKVERCTRGEDILQLPGASPGRGEHVPEVEIVMHLLLPEA